MYIVKADNTIEKLTIAVSDDTVSFETSELGTFVIDYVAKDSGTVVPPVEQPEEPGDVTPSNPDTGKTDESSSVTPSTGDTAPVALYVLLAFLAMVMAGGVVFTKKRVR